MLLKCLNNIIYLTDTYMCLLNLIHDIIPTIVYTEPKLLVDTNTFLAPVQKVNIPDSKL